MKKRIANIMLAAVAAVALVGGVVSTPVLATAEATFNLSSGQTAANPGLTSKEISDPAELVKQVINIAMYIIGIVAVAMIIWGGVQYMMSSGDSGKVKTAKNTIIYGCIGLAIALLSYAIVNFVTAKATGLTNTSYVQETILKA